MRCVQVAIHENLHLVLVDMWLLTVKERITLFFSKLVNVTIMYYVIQSIVLWHYEVGVICICECGTNVPNPFARHL